MNYNLLSFTIMGDNEGSLISLEAQKNIPFNIQRVYYIFGTKADSVRGKHAHRKLEQVIVAVSGSCKFRLDDGDKSITLTLNSPNIGLYLSNNIWREMFEFSPDCVLMVLANTHYHEADYIRDYDEFKKSLNKKTGKKGKKNATNKG